MPDDNDKNNNDLPVNEVSSQELLTNKVKKEEELGLDEIAVKRIQDKLTELSNNKPESGKDQPVETPGESKPASADPFEVEVKSALANQVIAGSVDPDEEAKYEKQRKKIEEETSANEKLDKNAKKQREKAKQKEAAHQAEKAAHAEEARKEDEQQQKEKQQTPAAPTLAPAPTPKAPEAPIINTELDKVLATPTSPESNSNTMFALLAVIAGFIILLGTGAAYYFLIYSKQSVENPIPASEIVEEPVVEPTIDEQIPEIEADQIFGQIGAVHDGNWRQLESGIKELQLNDVDKELQSISF